MTTTGKKNMIFGVLYFLATLGLGMYLGSKYDLPGPELGKWLKSMEHTFLKIAHTHGNLEALLNVVFGFLISRFGQGSALSRISSVLFVTGAIFHSGMALLVGLGVAFAGKLMSVGAIALVLAMALMIPILLKGVKKES